MEVLIFRTNISTHQQLVFLGNILTNYPVIARWTVDTEDVDNVLRIEAFNPIGESDIVQILENWGFYCEELSD
jgi:hypothetical protein